MKYIYLFLFQLLCLFSNGQTFTCKGKISIYSTKVPLQYANIYNIQEQSGTASNSQGYFEIPHCHIGDTLEISYVGYKLTHFVIQDKKLSNIFLKKQISSFQEIVISANNDYLYKMISQLKNNKKTEVRTSKTYFLLESKIDNKTVEVIESYYNTLYKNHHISHMALKKGRIGLKPIDNKYFISTATSRTFSMHNIFSKSKIFPSNPLVFSQRKLKRKYWLELENTYLNGGNKIYVISFKPKKKTTEFASGTIWLNKSLNQIIKIRLDCVETNIHPFVPIGNNSIQNVSFQITKSFVNIENKPYIDKVDFDYSILMKNITDGHEFVVETKAFLKAFDYNKSFDLPFFDFTPQLHQDFRDISLTKVDSIFWQKQNDFRLFHKSEDIDIFIRKYPFIPENFHVQNNNNHQLEFAYYAWQPKRFIINESKRKTIESSSQKSLFPSERFNLNVKLYLDVNVFYDTIYYQIASILDPVNTFYHFYLTKKDQAFINMYFDLMEIQKNNLINDISNSKSLSLNLLRYLYKSRLKMFEEEKNNFILQTNRGRNEKGMRFWSNYIKEKLKVDNLDWFDIYQNISINDIK